MVTGAARGLGEAIATRLCRDGHHVVVADLDEGAAQDAARRVAAAGEGTAVGRAVDVSRDPSVDALFDAVDQLHARVDVLVNNAGVLHRSVSEELSTERWLHELDVNLGGAMRCARAAYPLLRHSPLPSIVNLGSVGSTLGLNLRLAYTVTKTGIVGLTRELASEWGDRGIRVNAVAPGYVDTPMMRSGIEAGVLDERMILDRTPMGRFARADEIAAAVSFLASADASFVSGVLLPVDGGLVVDGTFHRRS